MVCLLGLLLVAGWVLGNPHHYQVGDSRNQWEVFAAKARGDLPLVVLVLVAPTDLHVVVGTVLGLVELDGGIEAVRNAVLERLKEGCHL